MPPTPLPRPATWAGRWTVTALIAAAGVVISRDTPLLADPDACATLTHLSAALFARALPLAPIAGLLAAVHGAAVFAAVALLWRFALAATSSPAASGGLALGLALTPAFAPTLGPSAVPAIALSLALPLVRRRREHGEITARAAARATVAVLAALAAFAPALTIGLAALAPFAAWNAGGDEPRGRRHAAAVASALLVILAGAAVAALTPGVLPPAAGAPTPAWSCLVPGSPIAGGRLPAAAAAIGAEAGPLVLAAALLGIYSTRTRRIGREIWILGGVTLVVAAAADRPDPTALGPTVAAVWVLAAFGLAELARDRTRRLGPSAALVTAAAIAVLQAARADAVDPDRLPLGHEQLTGDFARRLHAVLPGGAAIVREDALSDLMLRSLRGAESGARKDLRYLPDDAGAILDALGSRPVFALPRRQRTIAHLGFRLRDDFEPRVPGLSAVTPGGPCTTLTTASLPLPGLAGADRLALVADAHGARGPVVIYIRVAEPPAPVALDWPARTTRGFVWQRYDLAAADGASSFARDLAADAIEIASEAATSRHAARLELWRTPDAPRTLAVGIGRAIDGAAGRDLSGRGGVRICPSFAFRSGSFRDR
jgi:hypothetical protein